MYHYEIVHTELCCTVGTRKTGDSVCVTTECRAVRVGGGVFDYFACLYIVSLYTLLYMFDGLYTLIVTLSFYITSLFMIRHSIPTHLPLPKGTEARAPGTGTSVPCDQ